MQIKFQKIHGAGNDFVVFDNRDESIELTDEQVVKICDRHKGVGADGVIEVRTSPREECAAYMYYRNSDGSIAEMCGNGVRCFARFLADNDLLSKEERASKSFVVDTLAGIRPLKFEEDEAGKLIQATVGMGEPSFAPELIPTTLPATKDIAIKNSNNEEERLEPAVVQAVTVDARDKYVITCVNMGNPHAVMFLEYIDAITAKAFSFNPNSVDLEGPGAFLESNTKLFPQKTNVELAAVNGKNHIRMRVYERGVGETLACGTGACATAITAIILGKAEREAPVTVELPGGCLIVEWQPDNQVILTGPVETAFSGVLEVN